MAVALTVPVPSWLLIMNQVAARGVTAVLIPGVNGVGPSSTVQDSRTILFPAVALGPAVCVGCGVEGAVDAGGAVLGAVWLVPASGSRSPLQSRQPGMQRCCIPSGAGVSSGAGS